MKKVSEPLSFLFGKDANGKISSTLLWYGKEVSRHRALSLIGTDFGEAQEFINKLEGRALRDWMKYNNIQPRAEELPIQMYRALQQRGWTDLYIENMSPEKMFEEALSWEGILGYGGMLLEWARVVLKYEEETL